MPILKQKNQKIFAGCRRHIFLVSSDFQGEAAQKMAHFLTKNSKNDVFFLSKILNFLSIRSLVGVKIAHLETKKSKNFRRLSLACFLIVSSDSQGEATQKMAHFNKKSKNFRRLPPAYFLVVNMKLTIMEQCEKVM